MPWLLGNSRPFREFDLPTSRGLLPLHSCGWPSTATQSPSWGWEELRGKKCSVWITPKALHGSGATGRPHLLHGRLFLLQAHCEVLGRGLGGTQNHPKSLKVQGVLSTLQPSPTLIPPHFRWGSCSQSVGTCPRPQSHTGKSPEIQRCVPILLILT